MPLFFFDTDDGEHQFEDARGHEITDADSARREASHRLCDLAHTGLKNDGQTRVITAAVRDAIGAEIYRAEIILRLPTAAAN